MVKNLSDLKHTAVNIKGGGEVIILDTGAVIDVLLLSSTLLKIPLPPICWIEVPENTIFPFPEYIPEL